MMTGKFIPQIEDITVLRKEDIYFVDDVPVNILEEQLERLGLSKKVLNCLISSGMSVIGELLNFTEVELLKVRNLGKVAFEEIINKLDNLGLSLKVVRNTIIYEEHNALYEPTTDILPVNPLMQSQMITPAQETEQKNLLIGEIESLAEINKQALAARRQTVEVQVESKKLETALKTMDSIDKIINSVTDEKVLKRVTDNINTPMDMKMMAEAAERLTNTLKNLMNPNVLDGMGTKKKQKINFMFKSTGTVQGAIQIDNSND